MARDVPDIHVGRIEIRGIEAFDESGERLGYVDRMLIDPEGDATVRVRDDRGDVALWRPSNPLHEDD